MVVSSTTVAWQKKEATETGRVPFEGGKTVVIVFLYLNTTTPKLEAQGTVE